LRQGETDARFAARAFRFGLGNSLQECITLGITLSHAHHIKRRLSVCPDRAVDAILFRRRMACPPRVGLCRTSGAPPFFRAFSQPFRAALACAAPAALEGSGRFANRPYRGRLAGGEGWSWSGGGRTENAPEPSPESSLSVLGSIDDNRSGRATAQYVKLCIVTCTLAHTRCRMARCGFLCSLRDRFPGPSLGLEHDRRVAFAGGVFEAAAV